MIFRIVKDTITVCSVLNQNSITPTLNMASFHKPILPSWLQMRFLPAHDTKGELLFVIVVDAIVDEYKSDHRVVLCSFTGQFRLGPASSPPLMARLKDCSQLCAELSNHGDRGEHSPYIAREDQ
jgi:hypothetical protein